MAVNFLVRPERLIAKRSLIDGNKDTASTAFVAVAGTKTKFILGQDSLLEFKVEGNLSSVGGAAKVSLDVAIDGKLIGLDALPAGPAGPNGAADGLKGETVATAADVHSFTLQDTLDGLAAGEHSFELFFKCDANSARIYAAAASHPLKYVLIEHASAYPPHQAPAY